MKTINHVYSIEAGGVTHRINMDFNALCVLEAASGEGALGFVQEMGDWEAHPELVKFTKIRLLLCVALGKEPDEEGLALAGNILQKGGVQNILPVVMESFEAAFPQDMVPEEEAMESTPAKKPRTKRTSKSS